MRGFQQAGRTLEGRSLFLPRIPTKLANFEDWMVRFSLFLSAVEGVCTLIQNVFGLALGIVAITIFVLEIFTEEILAVLYFVIASVIEDEECFRGRRPGE